MNAYDAAVRIGECFDEDRIPYAIGGALSLGAHGAARATDDVDISAFVQRDELARVFDSLQRAGVMIDEAGARREVERIGLFVGRLGGTRIDVFISEHPQFADMRARSVSMTDKDGHTLTFMSAEDLMLYKLIYGRGKDVTDLERLVAVRTLDLAYVRQWLAQMLPAGDRRFTILEDLERRFSPG
jgi:hypothetical protein